MKRISFCSICLVVTLTSFCCAAAETEQTTAPVFTVESAAIVDGILDAAYGKKGGSVEKGIPTLSFPIDISGAPEGTVCYALYMDDPDSEPLCGFPWLHWMMANFTQTSLPEGYSTQKDIEAVQGLNSFRKSAYGGPTPPDKDHTYRITVYALDASLELQDGFSKDDFIAALEGHVLAETTILATYIK